MKKILVSFPFSSNDPEITKERIRIARAYCLKLLREGNNPINPTIIGLALVDGEENPDLSYVAWQEFCKSYVLVSDEMHVLQLSGWETSGGVADEIRIAQEADIKIVNIPIEEINF